MSLHSHKTSVLFIYFSFMRNILQTNVKVNFLNYFYSNTRNAKLNFLEMHLNKRKLITMPLQNEIKKDTLSSFF